MSFRKFVSYLLIFGMINPPMTWGMMTEELANNSQTQETSPKRKRIYEEEAVLSNIALDGPSRKKLKTSSEISPPNTQDWTNNDGVTCELSPINSQNSYADEEEPSEISPLPSQNFSHEEEDSNEEGKSLSFSRNRQLPSEKSEAEASSIDAYYAQSSPTSKGLSTIIKEDMIPCSLFVTPSISLRKESSAEIISLKKIRISLNKFYESARQGDPAAKETLRILANHNNQYAQYYYASVLQSENKINEAVKWYAKSAKQGHQEALNALEDLAQGEKGNREAQFQLGSMYSRGRSVKKNQSEAIKWYILAANQDHKVAQFKLGDRYSNGRGVEKDENKAVEWYAKSAKQNYPEALDALKKLAQEEKGNKAAQFQLGWIYSHGEGVDKNQPEAIKWYTLAANQDHKVAQYNLGVKYRNGNGVEKDENKAVEWYIKSAKQGYQKALDELKKIAQGEKGNKAAQFQLGWMYSHGEGVEENQSEAVKWYTLAAKQGDKIAPYNLGIIHSNEGELQDHNLAAKWFYKSAKQGYTKARELLEKGSKKNKNNEAALYYHYKLISKTQNSNQSSTSVRKSTTTSLSITPFFTKPNNSFPRAQSSSIESGKLVIDAVRDAQSARQKETLLETLARQKKTLSEKLGKLAGENNQDAKYYYRKVLVLQEKYDDAATHFYDAVNLGHVAAQKILEKLGGAPKDSVLNNNAYAQYYLGEICYDKFTQTKNILDLKQAVHWYTKSAMNEDPDAKEKLSSLREAECQYINNKKGRLDLSIGRIVLFRGIHFVTNLFDTPDKIQKIVNMLIDGKTFLISSAACKLTGKEFLADIPGQEELKAGKRIAKILKRFKSDSQNLYNKFHETYTNDHENFHKLLEDPTKAIDSNTEQAFTEYRWIFENLAAPRYPKTWSEAVKRNPFVSFSCNATHAMRYEAGTKNFRGGPEVKLNPDYKNNGEPKNRHLGRLFVAVLSPHDLWNLQPTFVVDKQAQGKLDISINQNNILTEDEVSFFGYIPQGIIQYSEALKIDNLPKEEIKNYKITNQNFRTKTGKLKAIIDKRSKDFESKANQLVEQENCLRIYSDIFEGFYTGHGGNPEKFTVTNWIHKITSKQPSIIASPIQGITPVTKEGIEMLAVNLTRRPVTLEPNWIGYLKEISLSGYNLSDSGSSFIDILDNSNIRLEELSLVACQLTAEDTKKIAINLKHNKFLKKLNLNTNTVGDEGAKIFFLALIKNKTFQNLALGQTQNDAFKKRTKLDFSQEDANDFKHFATLFSSKAVNNENTTLEELSLCKTQIENFKYFGDLFPSGEKGKSQNQTLLLLNLDLDATETEWSKIQRGLNRNKDAKIKASL